ncbi:c2H2-type zinc-finger domain-containing protein [Ditylenchus destructor]|nr:c2H2-type zinc-finger domain-containing protein [Ditylenchus destructor]
MFRCNQCPKAFEDNSSIRRHLSIKHFNYSPYLCKICKKTDQFHLTATEEDMNKHFETVHPGTKSSITLSREKIIEDKIKAAIDECHLPISQRISRDFKIESHRECDGPSDQLPFSATAIESGSTSTVKNEQINGEMTENAALDDIEIVYESVPQKVKNEGTVSKNISRDFKNNFHNGSNAPYDQSPFSTTATESGSISSHVTQEQNNGEMIENPAIDDIEIVYESVPQKIKDEVTAPKVISLGFKNALRQAYNVLCDETTVGASAKECVCSSSEMKQELSNNETTRNITADENNECQAYNILCDETTVDKSTEEGECSSSEMKQELSNNEATANITVDTNDDFHRKTIVQRESNVNLLETTSESNNKDLGRDSLATESNSCANDAPIFVLPQLPSVQRSPTMSNDTQSQAQLNSTDVSDETYNQIDGENICKDSTPAGQSTEMPLPSVEVNVFQNEQNIDEEFNEHDAIEPANQMRLRSSSNNSAANLIQRKRTLPMNDHHSRTKLSVKRLNPKQTNGTEMLYKCDHCSYASARKDHLIRHMRTHTGEKPFKCDQCSYASAQKANLICHMRTHTGEKPFKCDHCSYASAQKDNLIRHMRTHTGEKPFKCGHCTFACSQKSHLDNHVRTHTGEKPYKCDQCSYASAQKGNLICHMRTHTGEKPFKCGHCKYACADKSALNIHVRTHTGEKPYKCDKCPYASTQSTALKLHMRTHTGEKPFKCRHCSYACATSSYLNVHIRTHTGEKPYKCCECPFAGTSSSHLNHHVRNNHS